VQEAPRLRGFLFGPVRLQTATNLEPELACSGQQLTVLVRYLNFVSEAKSNGRFSLINLGVANTGPRHLQTFKSIVNQPLFSLLKSRRPLKPALGFRKRVKQPRFPTDIELIRNHKIIL
jgi:hypothetical protein